MVNVRVPQKDGEIVLTRPRDDTRLVLTVKGGTVQVPEEHLDAVLSIPGSSVAGGRAASSQPESGGSPAGDSSDAAAAGSPGEE